MLIYEGSIILIEECEFSVWDIPPLRPLLSGRYEVIDHTPRYAITHSFPSHEHLLESLVLGPWFSSIDHPISFGIFGYKDEEWVMLCYTVRSINPSRDPILPMVFPVKMGMLPNFPTDADLIDFDSVLDRFGPLQYCDDELCLTNLADRGLLINLITPPMSLNGPFPSKTTALFTEYFSSWSFCAASGRLVVVDDGNIRIMDFLVPPPS